jgi:hypothetical protein
MACLLQLRREEEFISVSVKLSTENFRVSTTRKRASEARALAQRSAKAAKEIKALISDSGQQVSAGVELVGETGKALEQRRPNS